ncbi:MAG: hypothetical protein LJE61_14405 [Thiocapsa sp.]|nr:hypothetical protein [Thiocapsa sp.]MCG6896078.1 hypothetical protein [Thiocapsa sp.]MCG6986381.1 hypothetical protein [Thiocapsa sp.]
MGPPVIGNGADLSDLGVEVDSSAGPPVGASLQDWEQAMPRVAHYLRALGVRDHRDHARLIEAIRSRFVRRVSTHLVADATETGIEATAALLDAWIAAQLGPGVPEPQQRMARAAVLGGVVEGWVAVWSGRVDEPLGERIIAASLSPAPEPAPLSMVPQRIGPCCHRLVRSIAKVLRGKPAERPHQPADPGRTS